jgi:hypothetical protein
MLKFVENHPYITMLLMAVSTIVGFVISEYKYQQKIEEEYFKQKNNDMNFGGVLDDYRFDEKV